MATARSRFVAATTRTSTRRGRVPPTRKNVPVSSTRSSFTCTSGSISPISSRNSVPPSASSMRPGLTFTAPVKAPFSWPNSSDSKTSRGSAPQCSGTNGRSARAERSWIARATSSFPVPLSPSTSTVESVGATRSTMRSTSCMRALFVRMPPNGSAPGARDRSATLSRRSCPFSAALRTRRSSSSIRVGLLR